MKRSARSKTKKSKCQHLQKTLKRKQSNNTINTPNQNKTIPTAQNITTTYQKLYYKLITTDKLVKKLRQAQETGLIKKQIINAQDEPTLGWKTQLSLAEFDRKNAEMSE